LLDAGQDLISMVENKKNRYMNSIRGSYLSNLPRSLQIHVKPLGTMNYVINDLPFMDEVRKIMDEVKIETEGW
jgi:hypothetical protein